MRRMTKWGVPEDKLPTTFMVCSHATIRGLKRSIFAACAEGWHKVGGMRTLTQPDGSLRYTQRLSR